VTIPSATYRIQFNRNFRLADARNLLPYLQQLGISHLYSSPQYQARSGSMHGYDVADPTHVNRELGTEEEFDRIAGELRERGMGLLLDIVPNHMAASPENPWWMDVLEFGPESAYASFFDIDWGAAGAKSPELQSGRVVIPNLTDFYEKVLANQGIVLRFDEKGFYAEAGGAGIRLIPGLTAPFSDLVWSGWEEPAKPSSRCGSCWRVLIGLFLIGVRQRRAITARALHAGKVICRRLTNRMGRFEKQSTRHWGR